MSDDKTLAALAHVTRALSLGKSKHALLDEIAWPPAIEAEFFAKKEGALPRPPAAEIDRASNAAAVKALEEARAKLDGEGPVHAWLDGVLASARDKERLLGATGTRDFGVISREIYGGARTSVFGMRNVDLAEHLLSRLAIHGADTVKDTADQPMTSDELVAWMKDRIQKKRPAIDLDVVLDPACTSKAIAGMSKLRVRPNAVFTAWEAEGLYRHEVETHAFTARNGSLQPHAPFLKSGGPRSTETQEGLAVFAELYHHALAVPRLERLALRVKTVEIAEDGASFLDAYRFLRDRDVPAHDAFLDAARVFRGGLPEGGAPFTKDVVYLSGLLRVHAFLAAFVRGGFHDECEMLVAGRIHLDDITAMVELRKKDLLARPKYRPRWLREWGTLLPYFAVSSFMSGVDLRPVEAHYAEVIRIATAG